MVSSDNQSRIIAARVAIYSHCFVLEEFRNLETKVYVILYRSSIHQNRFSELSATVQGGLLSGKPPWVNKYTESEAQDHFRRYIPAVTTAPFAQYAIVYAYCPLDPVTSALGCENPLLATGVN